MQGVLVDHSVLEKTSSAAQAVRFDREVGGILLGSYKGQHLHVLEATLPQIADSSSRFRFFRRSRGHQRLAEEAWRRSRGQVGYVGEWHSHPEDYPTPSWIDRTDWSRKVAEQRRDLVFLIVGRLGRYLERSSGLGRTGDLTEAETDQEGVLYLATPAAFQAPAEAMKVG